MVTRSPELQHLRSYIISTASAYLHNVRWVPGVTCRVCAGIPGPGYDVCYRCSGHKGRPGLADRLGFVTYAWEGGQAGRVLRAYKAQGQTSRELVAAVLTYAVVAHWQCIARDADGVPDGWTYVPSLAGRPGPHPLGRIASQFMGSIPYVPVVATPGSRDPRSLDRSHFSVEPTTAHHVLLIDDTWVAGGHLQSVSAALKAAGVHYITGLVVARWLDLRWENTKAFVDGLGDFDPDICPFTGQHC